MLCIGLLSHLSGGNTVDYAILKQGGWILYFYLLWFETTFISRYLKRLRFQISRLMIQHHIGQSYRNETNQHQLTTFDFYLAFSFLFIYLSTYCSSRSASGSKSLIRFQLLSLIFTVSTAAILCSSIYLIFESTVQFF